MGKVSPDTPSYNPNMVYILELATILALRDGETMQAVGENVASSLQSIVRDSSNFHPLVTSRVVSYLLNLLRLSYVSFLPTLLGTLLTTHQEQPFMRVPVVLHCISGFDQDVLESSAVHIVKGLS
jgi:brefeldin A-resistance guanine nucleotide exchange factor 1